MYQTFEERVFFSKERKYISTFETNELNNSIMISKVDEEYNECINFLNTLQSNADTIRQSIALKSNQPPLEETAKYLIRSGLTLEDLDKLSFIHVSGTKGKGSTCALTESILRSQGFKTGFFSSPHLISVTERIRINGIPVAKEKFIDAFRRVFNRLLATQQENVIDMPAYFKFLTVLCFHIFLEEKVDVVILEVGIGGEMDSTNIIRNTKTVGITSLGLEHTNLLGKTLKEIAWQKAGIIKPYSNVYTSATQPECLKVINERAKEKNATVHIVPEFAKLNLDEKSKTLLSTLNNVTKLNGALALQLAFDWLRNHKNGFHKNFDPNSIEVTAEMLDALINCNWPGRCQFVNYLNFNIHIDGAHTHESMTICSDWFEKVSNRKNPSILIFNTTGDRDSKKLLEILRYKNEFDMVCFVPNIPFDSTTKSDNQTPISALEQIKRAQLHAGNWHLLCIEADEEDNSQVFHSILDSFHYVRSYYGTQKDVDVLITGSLHLIGATILALNEYKLLLKDNNLIV